MKSSADSSRYFEFKHFRMLNDLVGLKVGTDGVLLGAWSAVGADVKHVWDVGTGTGVVALMIAQRAPVHSQVTGFEIDPAAIEVATANFANAPWSGNLHLVAGDVMTTASAYPAPDLIVSNPPYFKESASLSAKNMSRDCARRGVSLDFSAVIQLASQTLTPDGKLCMILPANLFQQVESEALFRKLYLTRVAMVSTKVGKTPSRMLCELSRVADAPCEYSMLALRETTGEYTSQYRELTSDYYLHL